MGEVRCFVEYWGFRVLAEIPHFPISPFPQRLAAIISEYPQIL
ncbi:hypothetical protein NIES298_41770 [Microcystis aeruginosa NIES-298]|nr:hypothetical protein NIES298_41770 [Microcystis aeruginosa NIES-298]